MGTLTFDNVKDFGFDSGIWTSLGRPQQEHVYQVLDNLNQAKNTADEALERLRVDCEHQVFQAEHRCSQNEELLSQLKVKSGQLERDKARLTEDLERCENLKRDYLRQYEEAYSVKLGIETKLYEAERAKNELSESVEKLMLSLESSETELQNLKESNDAMKNEVTASKLALQELEGKEFSHKCCQQQLRDDNQLLEQRTKWLEAELETKSEQLLVLKQDRSDRVRELELSAESRKHQLHLAEEQVKSLQETLTSLQEKHQHLLQRIGDEQEERLKMEECFDGEIESQKRLVNLYKSCADEQGEKCAELLAAVDEMQSVLKNNSDHLCALESEKNTIISQLEQQITDMDAKVQSLETELERANQQLERFRNDGITEEEMAQMAPAAAAASQLLKRGKTLSQIYSEYIDLYNNLEREKIENRKLNESMRLILKEIEEKTPALRRQREENVRLSATVGQLTKQMDAAMTEMSEMRRSTDEKVRKSGYLDRENKRLKTQVLDLNRQVSTLLREIELARGRPVADDEVTSSSAGLTSAADVITEQLITFKDIQQMQEQNQRLVMVTRDLSTKLEDMEKNDSQSKLGVVKDQLETLKLEIERLQSAEKTHKHCLNIVTRQRDMFKVLLQCSGSNAGQLVSSMHLSGDEEQVVANLSSSRLDNSALNMNNSLSQSQQIHTSEDPTLRTMLKDIQEEFSTYKKDKAQNDKIVEQELKTCREENSNLKSMNARLASQLDTVHEKIKLQETNSENYRKEISILRDINLKYTSTIAKYEQDLANLRTDMLGKVEKLGRLEQQTQHLQIENKTLRAFEKRFQEENEQLRQHKHTQNILLANLQAIQVNLEKRDYDVKAGLENKIEALKKDEEKLRQRLNKETSLLLDQKSALEKDVIDLSKQLAKERDEAQTLRSKLKQAEEQIVSETIQIQGLQNKVAALSSPVKLSTSVLEDDSTASVKQLEILVKELEVEKVSLENRIRQLECEVDNYKSIAESVEAKVAEQELLVQELNEQMDQKLKERQENCDFYKSQMEAMEKERQNMVNENIKLNEEAHAMNASLRKELFEAQQERQNAINRRESALNFERSAKSEIEKHISYAQEANNKYQQELILHAADVQALTTLKNEVKKVQEELQAAKQRQIEIDLDKEKVVDKYNSEYETWTTEKRQLEERITELKEQCETLEHQTERLTSQLLVLRKASTEEGSAGLTTQPDDIKTSEQLLQLTRFLRREKDIAETKSDAFQIEITRMSDQLIHLRRQLDDAKTALVEERERVQKVVVSDKQHSELLGRVEQLNLVTESNRLLRQEQDTLRIKIKELESKNDSLTSQIQPLSERITILINERDNKVAENQLLEEEKVRWKDRCQQLIENTERLDPEKYKKACTERDELKQEVEELEISIDEISTRLDSANDLIAESKSKNDELEDRLVTLSEEVQEKGDKIVELEHNIEVRTQSQEEMKDKFKKLQELARKYKQEVTELKKSNDTVTSSENQAFQLRIVELEQALKSAKEVSVSMQRKISELTNEIDKSAEDISEKQMRIGIIESQMKKKALENENLKKRVIELEKGTSSAGTLVHATASSVVHVVEPEIKHTMPVKPIPQPQRDHTKQTAEITPQPRPTPLPHAAPVVAVPPTPQTDSTVSVAVLVTQPPPEPETLVEIVAPQIAPPVAPVIGEVLAQPQASISTEPSTSEQPVDLTTDHHDISPSSVAGPSHRVAPLSVAPNLKRPRDEEDEPAPESGEPSASFALFEGHKRARTSETEAVPVEAETDYNRSGSSDIMFVEHEHEEEEAEDGSDERDENENAEGIDSHGEMLSADDDIAEDEDNERSEDDDGNADAVGMEEGEMDEEEEVENIEHMSEEEEGELADDDEVEDIEDEEESVEEEEEGLEDVEDDGYDEEYHGQGQYHFSSSQEGVVEYKPKVAVAPVIPGEIITLSSDSDEEEAEEEAEEEEPAPDTGASNPVSDVQEDSQPSRSHFSEQEESASAEESLTSQPAVPTSSSLPSTSTSQQEEDEAEKKRKTIVPITWSGGAESETGQQGIKPGKQWGKRSSGIPVSGARKPKILRKQPQL